MIDSSARNRAMLGAVVSANLVKTSKAAAILLKASSDVGAGGFSLVTSAWIGTEDYVVRLTVRESTVASAHYDHLTDVAVLPQEFMASSAWRV